MKNIKGLVGLLAFVGCLWVVVVTTYGAQLQNDGKQTTMLPMADSSCSSSTSTSQGSE